MFNKEYVMKLTEELFLINKQKNWLKRFRKYENIAHKGNDYSQIDFCYIFRTSIKRLWKGTRIENIYVGVKEYEKMLWVVRKKQIII